MTAGRRHLNLDLGLEQYSTEGLKATVTVLIALAVVHVGHALVGVIDSGNLLRGALDGAGAALLLVGAHVVGQTLRARQAEGAAAPQDA